MLTSLLMTAIKQADFENNRVTTKGHVPRALFDYAIICIKNVQNKSKIVHCNSLQAVLYYKQPRLERSFILWNRKRIRKPSPRRPHRSGIRTPAVTAALSLPLTRRYRDFAVPSAGASPASNYTSRKGTFLNVPFL